MTRVEVVCPSGAVEQGEGLVLIACLGWGSLVWDPRDLPIRDKWFSDGQHRPLRVLPYPYQVHALLHHQVFRGDVTYHVQRKEDRDVILFQWWQAPLLLAVHVPAVWGLQVVSGFPVFWGGMTGLALYYGLYEYLHWCMHNPTGRWVECTRVFQYLDAQHRLHHRLWRVNFNVVLPLGNMVFGTFRPTITLSKPP